MMPLLRLARGLAVLVALAAPPLAQTVAVVDVSLVPLDSAHTIPHHTVLIEDGVIVSVGGASEVAVPPEATVVDGAGRFLMPGLSDMHMHFAAPGVQASAESNRATLALLLAHGVTSVRNLWGSEALLALRDSVDAGHLFGPRIWTTGPFVVGRPDTLTAPWSERELASGEPGYIYARTEEDGRAAVRYHAARGYDGLKVHNQTPMAVYRGVIDESERLGVAVVGHAPWAVGLGHVLTHDGQSSVEHYDSFVGLAQASGAPSRTASAWYDRTLGAAQYASDDRLALLAELAEVSGMWFTPTTLVAEWYSGPQPDMIARLGAPEVLRYTSAAQRGLWRAYAEGFAVNYAAWGLDMNDDRIFALRTLRALHGAGARLLVGSDAPATMAPQGLALHDEMALWAEAGLSPLAILQAAALAPHAYFREVGFSEFTGAIAVGQPADLVLLNADPLADIAHAREIESVIARGRLLTRTDLDAMLAIVEATYAASGENAP
ncbi:amidohydrolase family protein [Rubricoccus marinus]|nr:amidohydrolase family protein [Rubricoccus marinus]